MFKDKPIMMSDITLPALPLALEINTPSVKLYAYNLDQLRARDLEVARVVLEACKIAVKSEHLNDPQCGEDDAYDNAVSDCFNAIRALKVSHD